MLFRNKIMKLLLLFVLLLGSVQLSADSTSRRNELIGVIDQELREVTRLNKQTRTSKPDLLLRMAELMLEKARLLKELENASYISLSAKKRQGTSKKKFFRKSNAYFIQAQKTCRLILRKFPKYKNRSEVYYILAYNAKEFQQDKKAKVYFTKSVKTSKKSSFTSTRSQIALAEIYFNRGDYKQAISLYERAFKKKTHRDKWFTKDSYNLAWSYFRVGRKTKAIKVMKNSYRLSKNRKYVDMTISIERDLAYFYTDSGKVSQAVQFYKSIGKNIATNLLKVSNYLINRGKFSQAEKTLKQALRYKVSEVEDIAVNIKLLSLYERFGKYKSHFRVSKILVNYHKQKKLNPEQVKVLDYQLRRVSAIVQKQVSGKQYKSQRKKIYSKAKTAVGFFNLLAQFDPLNDYKYSFLGGETYYAAGMFNTAMGQYSKSLSYAQKASNEKYIKLSNEGMMASLAGKGITKKTKDKYVEVVYLNYLKQNPKSKKSNKIYQRLFSIYFAKKDIASCERTLVSYKNNFPKSFLIQEAMLARIMDHYKKKGDHVSLRKWVDRIKSGEFKVSKKYAKKVKLTLLTMQFENVEKATSKGQKKEALALYVEIYKDPTSSLEAKKNAAYNIATLFHELGDTYRSYGWSERALSHMNGKNVKRFQASFLVIANELFNNQKFNESSKLYSLTLEKLCKQRSSNKTVFLKNAVIVSLAQNKIEDARQILNSAYRCNISTRVLDSMELELLKFYVENKNWSGANQQVAKLSKSKRSYKDLIYPLGKIRRAFLASGRSSKAKSIESQILNFYKKVKNKRKMQLEALDVVASVNLNRLERKIDSLTKFELAFPDKKFNVLLKKKFTKLDSITTAAIGLMKVGSGKGMMRSYSRLIFSYEHLIKEVSNFTPPGKSPEYINSFKKSMGNLVKPLQAKVRDFRKEALKQMKMNKILSKDNKSILFGDKFVAKYILNNNGVLMDRGGRR
ncbi:hypothetical protein A9Q84_05815 [Halobacteriovorax marinus]|uniref:Tetratricopeptide repeat protein n=1 Tax=Halobacteriovorax marinus TaxID=97084 RepID=A0A1Y5FBJ4_9BACT|nr:hypothetical protein A9Q84_05815 [Halobacteriovorax marinus]